MTPPSVASYTSGAASNDTATSPRECKRHTYFYASPIILLVEDTLYGVDKALLTQFQVFKDMFEAAGEFNKDLTEGLTDDNPIQLHGVTTFEMDSVLHVLDSKVPSRDASIPSMNAERWQAVLRLATMWDFAQLRSFAIQAIEDLKLGPVKMIVLAWESEVEKWLKPSYVELCTRTTPLTADEGKVLGLDLVIQLARIRETLRDARQ
ncbi:hypothetical protein FRC02_007713, partial [Tulasnella sp. 418]